MAPADTFSNFSASTLSAAITTTPSPGTTETWNITSTSTFAQTTGQSRFLVPANADGSGAVELVIGTTPPASGTTMVVSRGAEGTTPITHASGAPITEVVTKGSLQAMEQTVNKGAVSGYAPLDGSGHVPLANLPPDPGRNVHYTVAASNANAAWKASADYICTGSNDHTTINNAITATSALGGTVEFSEGQFTCGGTITQAGGVKLKGQGANATVVSWNTDLGTGQYAIVGSADSGPYDAIEGIWMRGPGYGSWTAGTAPANMNGLNANKAHLIDVRCEGFNHGADMNGDHNLVTRCQIVRNYYNVALTGSVLGGNMTFVHNNIENATLANFYIAGANSLNADIFQLHCGSAPYSFYRDGSATAAMFTGGVWNEVFAENPGNGVIWDNSSNNATTFNGTNVLSHGMTTTSSSSYRYATNPHDWWYILNNCQNTRIYLNASPPTAANKGIWLFNREPLGIVIEDWNGPPANMFGTTGADLALGFNSDRGMLLRWRVGDISARTYYSGSVISAGDVVRFTGSGGAVVRNDGNGPIAGVALSSTTGGSNQIVIVAISGVNVPVNYDGSAPTTGNPLTISGTTLYHVIAAPMTSTVVGTANAAGSSGQVNTTLAGGLQGLSLKSFVVNVMDYGAVGDGSHATADTAAFTAAINAINALTNGGEIFVPTPQSTYNINATLPTITAPVRLRGQGKGVNAPGTVITFAAGVPGFTLTNNNASGSIVEGLHLKGSDTSLGTNDGLLIQASVSVIRDCWIQGFGRHGVNVFTTTDAQPQYNANHDLLQNLYISSNYGKGLQVMGDNSNVVTAINVAAYNNGDWGLYCNSLNSSTFIGFSADGNGNQFTGTTRKVTDAVFTNGSAQVTSATAAFVAADKGSALLTSSGNIPFRGGARIGTVTNGTTIQMVDQAGNALAAGGSGTAQPLSIVKPGAVFDAGDGTNFIGLYVEDPSGGNNIALDGQHTTLKLGNFLTSDIISQRFGNYPMDLEAQGYKALHVYQNLDGSGGAWGVGPFAGASNFEDFTIFDWFSGRQYIQCNNTASATKIGFFGVTPVAKPSTTGTTTGFSAGSGTTVVSGSTFTGNTGSTAYTVGDIVNALKRLGLLAS